VSCRLFLLETPFANGVAAWKKGSWTTAMTRPTEIEADRFSLVAWRYTTDFVFHKFKRKYSMNCLWVSADLQITG
jgi:hypothetical protein